MVKTPRTYSSHCGNANHTCTLRELEAHITRLGEQRQAQGCGRKALGTPGEEVSKAPRWSLSRWKGLRSWTPFTDAHIGTQM
jgi:hypothetical protein